MLGRPLDVSLGDRADKLLPVHTPETLLECRSGGMLTPLLEAVRHRNVVAARALLSLGANPYAFDRSLRGIREHLALPCPTMSTTIRDAAMAQLVDSIVTPVCSAGCRHVGDVLRNRTSAGPPDQHFACLETIARRTARWGGLKAEAGPNCVQKAVDTADFVLAVKMARMGAPASVACLRAAIRAGLADVVSEFLAAGVMPNSGRLLPLEVARTEASKDPSPVRLEIIRVLTRGGAHVSPAQLEDNAAEVKAVLAQAAAEQKPRRKRMKV